MLGVAETATPREIKSAYARLAKLNRPEQDATKFEALRNAYETALHWAQTPTETQQSLVSVSARPSSDSVVVAATLADAQPRTNTIVIEGDHVVDHLAAWASLKARIAERLESRDATQECSPDEQALLDDMCEFARHPATLALDVAARTEATILDWGGQYELPNSVARFIWNYYELEARIAFARAYGPLAQFDVRQSLAQEWREIMGHIRAQPSSPMAQLFRPMRASEKLVYATNFGVRRDLKHRLNYLRQRFAQRVAAINVETADFIEHSAANRLPRISLEAIAVALVTVLLTTLMASNRSGNASEHANPIVLSVLGIVLGFALTAAYTAHIKPHFEALQAAHPARMFRVEIAAALLTLALYLWGRGSSWWGVLTTALVVAIYVALADLRGGYFQRFWGGEDAGSSLAGSLFILLLSTLLGYVVFPQSFTEACVLMGVVVAGMTVIAPPMSWSISGKAWRKCDGSTVPTHVAFRAALATCAVLFLTITAQVVAFHVNPSLVGSIEVASGVAGLASMALFGLANSAISTDTPPLVTYGRIVVAVVVFNLATKQWGLIPSTLSLLIGALMLIKAATIAWVLR
jgi:hypothetical protein